MKTCVIIAVALMIQEIGDVHPSQILYFSDIPSWAFSFQLILLVLNLRGVVSGPSIRWWLTCSIVS